MKLAKYFSNYIGYFYGLLTVIIIVNIYGEDDYGNYLLAGFYSSVVLALFSSKPFSKAISDNNINYADLIFKEFSYKIIGCTVLFISVFLFGAEEQVLFFIIIFCFTQMFKVTDGCFEHYYLRRAESYSGLFWFNLFFKTVYFIISCFFIIYTSLESFSIFSLIFSFLEQNIKYFLLYKKNQMVFKKIEFQLFKDKFFQQNIFGTINKQFDTVLIFIISGSGGEYANYLLFKQFGSVISNLSMPITHITSKFGYRYSFILCLFIILVLIVSAFGGVYFFLNENAIPLFLFFLLAWCGVLLSVIPSFYLISNNLFSYQRMISIFNSIVLISIFLFLEGFSSNGLIMVKLVVVYFPLLLQLIIIWLHKNEKI